MSCVPTETNGFPMGNEIGLNSTGEQTALRGTGDITENLPNVKAGGINRANTKVLSEEQLGEGTSDATPDLFSKITSEEGATTDETVGGILDMIPGLEPIGIALGTLGVIGTGVGLGEQLGSGDWHGESGSFTQQQMWQSGGMATGQFDPSSIAAAMDG